MKLKNRLKYICLTNIPLITVVLIALISVSSDIYARAGGAGGYSSRSSSGGSSSGGGDGLIILIYFLLGLPFPANIISIAIVIYVAYILHKIKRQQSPLNTMVSSSAPSTSTIVNSYSKPSATNQNVLKRLPADVDTLEFTEKAKKAFHLIQNAWEMQNISKVRKFISDSVYQRFNTQFIMMQQLKQKNLIEKVKIEKCIIVDTDCDELFNSITVQITATLKDTFTSKLYPDLDEKYNDTFMEYWTFIRKVSHKEGNIYSNNNCPNCGADLSDSMGEVGKCSYCSTILNGGDFDWVLSEITQADDYVITIAVNKNYKKIHQQAKILRSHIPNLSIQMLEDKASNAFFQIKGAEVLRKPEQMRRFVNDTLYSSLEEQIKADHIIYNRLYINSANVIAFENFEDTVAAHIRVKYSFQKVKKNGAKYELLQNRVLTDTTTFVLEHKKGDDHAKGDLLSHQCPSCGSPLLDTTNVECEYCGAIINSPEYGWIVREILTINESMRYMNSNKASISKSVDINKDSKVLSTRDYIFNNTLVIAMADGKLDDSEVLFINRLARKMGYNEKKIKSYIDFAKQGKISIRMPNKQAECQKVYDKMVDAAMADGEIQIEEKQILDQVKVQYLEKERLFR